MGIAKNILVWMCTRKSISIAVRNAAGKMVMECVIETKASTTPQFYCWAGRRILLEVMFEEAASAAWLYDLLKPYVTEIGGVRSAQRCLDAGKRQPELTRSMPAGWPEKAAASKRIPAPSITVNMAYAACRNWCAVILLSPEISGRVMSRPGH